MVLGDYEDDRRLLKRVREGQGYLVHFGGIMNSLKTTGALTSLYWLTDNSDQTWKIAKAFTPDGSVRFGIDPEPGFLRSRAGVELHREPIHPERPERIAYHMLDNDYKIAIIDECHFFAGEGMALRPVIRSLLDHNIGIITISLDKDVGDREIAIHEYLEGKATALGRIRRPRCQEPNCWDVSNHNQLLINGHVPEYKGFEVLVGDVKEVESKDEHYSVLCSRHYVSPPLHPNFEDRKPGPISLRPEEIPVIEALKGQGLLPNEAGKEYFL